MLVFLLCIVVSLAAMDEENLPNIVWLLTFPGSGTTFTTILVEDATGTTTANNYGTGSFYKNGTKVSGIESKQLYENRVNGPFVNSDLPLPEEYILTRTHCLCTCYDCKPVEYISRGRIWFFTTCLMGTKFTPPNKIENVQYDSALVFKAVHVIRDPFSNIVSRFLKHFKWNDYQHSHLTAGITNSPEGFQTYCKKLDEMFLKHEQDTILADLEKKAMMEHVPCRSEFFKYIQWHNSAFTTTNELHKMPVLVINYEDYCKDMNATLNSLLDFLRLNRKLDTALKTAHCFDHIHYYTDEQRKAIRNLIHYAAEPSLLQNLVPRYQHLL